MTPWATLMTFYKSFYGHPMGLKRSLMALNSSRKSSHFPPEKVAREGDGEREGKVKRGYFFGRNKGP